jgi:hypothetical protein
MTTLIYAPNDPAAGEIVFTEAEMPFDGENAEGSIRIVMWCKLEDTKVPWRLLSPFSRGEREGEFLLWR